MRSGYAAIDGVVQWAAVDLTLVAAALVTLVAAITLRRRQLMRRGGIEMSLRTRRRRWGGGWMFGVALYRGDAVDWFRTFSLAWRPKRVLPRRSLVVRGRRAPHGAEVYDVPVGHVVLTCELDGRSLEVSLAPAALTGILAWLESSPPGEYRA